MRKLSFLLLAVFFLGLFASAQEALMPTPKQQFFGEDGTPLAGGKLYSYSAGTSTPLATYTDSTGLAQNTNPVILDTAGRAAVWLGPSFYKLVLTDSSDVTQWTSDNVSSYNLPFVVSSSFLEGGSCLGSIGSDIVCGVQASHRLAMSNNNGATDLIVGQNTNDLLTNKTLDHPILQSPTVSGPFAISQLNTVTLYASQFSGADASCKILNAISSLRTSGGVINALDLTDVGGTGTCVIDPGLGKTVTLLLGPNVYNISQLVLRSNFAIIGVGSSNCAEPCNGTVLQASNALINPIVIPLSPPVIDARIEHLNLNATPGNASQDGIHIAGGGNGGLWYSSITDVAVTGFVGNSILLDSQNVGAPSDINQFLAFRDVTVFRGVAGSGGGGPAVKIIGFNGQYSFDRCEFDGNAIGDGIDVSIGQGTPAPVLSPYSINFNNVTMQYADHALDISGATNFKCQTCHFEHLWGLANIISGVNFGSFAIAFDNSYINGDVGIHAGAGYILNLTQSSPNATTVKFDANYLYSVPSGPDHLCVGHCENVTGFGDVVNNTQPYNVIGGGLDPNGGGFKHARAAGCATAAAANATCDTTLTWGTPFADVNYTAVCSGERATSGVPMLEGTAISAAKTAAAITIRTLAQTAAAAQFTGIDCIAVHDVPTNF